MISVIIPTCNEARYLSPTLEAIAAASIDQPHEVLVVDAASADPTTAIAKARGANVIEGAIRRRAAQMNLGAAQARGDILLFLHADTVLPPRAFQQIATAMADPRAVGGAFARRYDSRSWVLRITCALADARGRMIGWFLGDQAIFVRAPVFQALGGFRNFELFEDLDFSRRLRGAGRVVLLHPPVVSAARRFEERGALRTTAADLVLTLRYLRGVSPNEASEADTGDRGEAE